MIFGLVLTALFLFGIGIVYSKLRDVAKLNESWMRVAGRMKLAFRKSNGILDTPGIEGEMDGFPVSVRVNMERKGDGVAQYTVYSVVLPEGSDIESLLDKASARVEAVRTGHPGIDKLLDAGGFDRGKLREMMSDLAEMTRMKFVKTLPGLGVSGRRIYCKVEGVDSDPQLMMEKLGQMLSLAKKLDWTAKGGAVATGAAIVESALAGTAVALAPSVGKPSPAPERLFASKPVPAPMEKPSPSPTPERLFASKPVPAPMEKPSPSPTPERLFASKPEAASTPRFSPNIPPPSFSKPAPEPLKSEDLSLGARDPEALVAAGAEKLSAVLFAKSFPGAEEKGIIDGIKGLRVSWTGKLKSVQEYGMDFNFNGGAGCKAAIDLCEVVNSSGIRSVVKASVQLPKGSSEALKSKYGQELRFSGEILKIEAFAREFFIANGSLEL